MKTLIIIILSTCMTSIHAQTIATTEDGKKVELNSDGTWEFIVEKKSEAADTIVSCTDYIKLVEDKVTGQSLRQSEPLVVADETAEKGFVINMYVPNKTSVILLITALGAGSCIDEGQKINILFTDGSRMELLTNGKFNCEKQAVVYFGDVFGKKDKLVQLQTKKIDILRVWTSDNYVELQLSSEEATALMNSFSCVFE